MCSGFHVPRVITVCRKQPAVMRDVSSASRPVTGLPTFQRCCPSLLCRSFLHSLILWNSWFWCQSSLKSIKCCFELDFTSLSVLYLSIKSSTLAFFLSDALLCVLSAWFFLSPFPVTVLVLWGPSHGWRLSSNIHGETETLQMHGCTQNYLTSSAS